MKRTQPFIVALPKGNPKQKISDHMEVKNERSTKSILQRRRLRELLYLRSVYQQAESRGQADLLCPQIVPRRQRL